MTGLFEHLSTRVSRWAAAHLGGPERARVVMTFAAVLGLDGADVGAVGSMAAPLQHAFHIGRTDFGLLLTASLSAAAAATFAFGRLVDRTHRIHLLTWAVVAWAGVMVLSGCVSSYGFLMASRVLIGAATAAAAPAVASLVGDYFDPGERGAVYSTILSGEMIGSGIGFLVSGELATWTWRAGFVALAIPAGAIAWALHRLHEPARGGGDRLPARGDGAHGGESRVDMKHEVRQADVEPRRDLVLRQDPRKRSLWWAVGYVLRIPTNRVLIIASAIGYFYFTGVRTFGVEYLGQWFHVGHALSVVLLITAGAGAIAGVLTSGRVADHLIRRGHLRARVWVPIVCFLVAAVGFLFALLTRSLWVGLPLLALGAAGLGGVSPPLDAARLDIMPGGLWGRAESVRMFFRKAGEAVAPFAFGFIADSLFGGSGAGPLHSTFLVMLILLGAGGAVALFAIGSYPRDVATAQAAQPARP